MVWPKNLDQSDLVNSPRNMEQHRCFVGDLEVIVLHPLCVLAQLQQVVYLLAGPGPGHLVAVVTHEHEHGGVRQPRLLHPRQHAAHLPRDPVSVSGGPGSLPAPARP